MIRNTRIKAALIAVLAAAAWVGPRPLDRYVAALLVFALANVLLTPPGTLRIRVFSICAALAALVRPQYRTAVLLFVWLVWPPTFLIAWALARARDDTPEVEGGAGPAAARRARVAIAAIIGAVAIGSIAYRLILAHGLAQSAALFVGLPALLAIVVVFGVSPRSATGVACKAVTIGLLVSVLFLGEGVTCVMISAPLFYVIAIAIGFGIDRARRGFGKPPQTAFMCVVALTFVPMSLEGVTDATSFNRDQWVSETRIVHASPQAVEHAMLEPPRFDRVLPLYLRAGFPRPISTRLTWGAAGTRLVIRFRGGETRLDGVEPRIGDLTLDLEEMQPGLVRWRAVGDDSHMTHFLLWREARVQWEAVDASTTKVTWALRYRRGLDPAWYFGPWERYATRLAAGYLIDSVATP